MRRLARLSSVLVSACICGYGLNPSLDVRQYAHTAWKVRDGFSLGNIYAIAQTPDGFLWFGSEFGLFRFDGVRSVLWMPPQGQHIPGKDINSLLVTRDGALWIGTFSGLAIWNGSELITPPELRTQFVSSLFEDHEGTVWAASLGEPGRLCALRNTGAQCYGEEGAFGRAVWALYEDSPGVLWAAAQTGLWRVKPGPLVRYPAPELIALNRADDGRLLIALHGAGLLQLDGDRLKPYPIRSPPNWNRPLAGRDLDSNRLLRDRDGSLWIGAVERGLIHVHQGRTDFFSRSDGLSGDVILSMFEDREGNIWSASTGGLDRFRELPVATISVKQGLSSDATQAVLAATDGSIWITSSDGLTRWVNGQTTIFRKSSGLPDDATQSLFQDQHGRIWVSSTHGLSYFQQGRFASASPIPAGDVHFITGDNAGNLWLSAESGLLHMLDGRLIDRIPWSVLGGARCCAEVLLPDREPGGLWLGFWTREGGVSNFRDGRRRALYTNSDGIGRGGIADLLLDRDGALWAATQEGGLNRLKDGRIAALTTRNGLPCDSIHWTIEDEQRSFWLYTGCGLVRITRAELERWIADPGVQIQTRLWDAADGVRLRSSAATAYGPRVSKAPDGKVWFVTGEGVQVVDPRHPAVNEVPPLVHILQIEGGGRKFSPTQGLRLPARIRDVEFEFTALSLSAPEKIRFKYMLEGQDTEWKEVLNERRAHYSNLRPRHHRFRVIACNNSGVWNETGDTLEFSIEPRFFETGWFVFVCAAFLLAAVWGLQQLRVRRLAREFNARIEERVDERTRIARELHDTLLQSFQGLMFSFQAARNLLPGRTEQAMRTLDEAIEAGDAAITEGRHAIQGLRANLAQESAAMEILLSATGSELARSQSAGGPQFKVTVAGTPQPLAPLLQDEVYRIAREILRNAFRHAHASHIEAELAYDDQFFRLRIRDDGIGIDRKFLEAGARQGHWGLPGARERAKRIGARLQLWSEPGAGTEAELCVPARIAYATTPRRNGFRLFRAGKIR